MLMFILLFPHYDLSADSGDAGQVFRSKPATIPFMPGRRDAIT